MAQIFILLLVFGPIVAAFFSYYIGRQNKDLRDWFVIGTTLVTTFLMIPLYYVIKDGGTIDFKIFEIVGFGLHFRLDGFRYLYSLIASFMFLISAVFGKEYFSSHYHNRNRFYFFYLLTLGATLGVFLSGSLYSLFVFFEIMTFTSYVWVMHDETLKAKSAATSYLFVGIIGGMMMLIGIFFLYVHIGTLEISQLLPAWENYTGNPVFIYVAAILMLVGFAGKAGVFLLHFWLPQAHPVAPAPASALLSGILTKTGIFGILILSTNLLLHDYYWGILILILGTCGMFIGALRGVFSIDLKKTLALSSVSQIGFIMVGIGMQNILGDHNALAVRGTFLHMVNHSLLKLLLFNLAGVIYMKLHTLDLNDLRGYGRGKPFLALMFLLGALSISGFPFWSGYISKTLIHEAIVEKIWMFTNYNFEVYFFQIIEAIFILSGGLTTAYMTKLFVCIFIEKHPTRQSEYNKLNKNYMSGLSKLALSVPALMVFVFGAFPAFYDHIADIAQVFMHGHAPTHAVHYFAWPNIKGTLMSIIIGVIVYFAVIRPLLMTKTSSGQTFYREYWPNKLDIGEFLHKPLIGKILPAIGSYFSIIVDTIPKLFANVLQLSGKWFAIAIDNVPRLFGYSVPIIGNLVGSIISDIPAAIGRWFYSGFLSWSNSYHKPVLVESEEVENSYDGNIEGKDYVLSSSLDFSLIQFAGGIVFVVIVMLLFKYNS